MYWLLLFGASLPISLNHSAFSSFTDIFSAQQVAQAPVICPLLSGPISILGMATKED